MENVIEFYYPKYIQETYEEAKGIHSTFRLYGGTSRR